MTGLPNRHESKARSGTTSSRSPRMFDKKWTADLGGRLTSPVDRGRYGVRVHMDRPHTLFAVDEASGTVEKMAFTLGDGNRFH